MMLISLNSLRWTSIKHLKLWYLSIVAEEDGCQNPLYFTNSEDVLFETWPETSGHGLSLLVLCCIGGLLFPLGWLLVSINKSKDARVQLTQQQMVTAMDPLENELNSEPRYPNNRPTVQTRSRGSPWKWRRGRQMFQVHSAMLDTSSAETQTPKKTGGSINRASS